MSLLIDPPSGWKYGFPRPAPTIAELKEYEGSYLGSLASWLAVKGYPVEEVNFAVKHCRYIGEPDQPHEEFIEECRKLDNASST